MKLLYLWIENYKNIKSQEFSFSSNEQVKINSRTNDTFDIQITTLGSTKSIYSTHNQNIDITCIVGKNGSGKTAILDCVYHVDWLSRNFEMQDGDIKIKYFAIYRDKDDYYIASDCRNNFKIIINEVDKSNNYYVPIPDGNINDEYKNVCRINHYTSEIPYIIDLCRDDNLSEEVDISKIYSYLCDNDNFDKYKHVFIKVSGNNNLEIDEWDKPFDAENNDNNLSSNEKYLQYAFLKIMITIYLSSGTNVNDENNYARPIISDYRKKFNYDESLKNIQKMFLSNTCEVSNLAYMIFSNYTDFEKIFKPTTNPASHLKICATKNGDVSKIIKLLHEIQKIDNAAFPLKRFFNKGIDSDTISSGELAQLWLEIAMHTAIEGVISKIKDGFEHDTIILLLDEPEVRFHPDYARKFISNLIKLLRGNKLHKYNFQVIISTHSPFILSDMDSRDIILLEEGKQDEKTINTFALNIHTLLKVNFLPETPIGEFARNYIEILIKALSPEKNKKKFKYPNLKKIKKRFKDNEISIKSFDDIKRMIEIIDDRLIKNKLFDMFDMCEHSEKTEKDYLKRLIAQRDRIEKEIKNLYDENGDKN